MNEDDSWHKTVSICSADKLRVRICGPNQTIIPWYRGPLHQHLVFSR